jgi:hypothetical protein
MTKVLNKRQKLEKVGKTTKNSLCGKRRKYLTKVPPFLDVFAGVEVSCSKTPQPGQMTDH